MNVNAAFKLFDVRGHYPEEVDERLAFVIGKALVLLRRPKKVLVASDTRESSPILKKFLVDGLTLGETQVYDLFEVPIPEFYFSVATGEYDLGVIITASHVAENQNGFKIVDNNGIPFDESEILTLKNLVGQMENDPIVVPKKEPTRVNNTEHYIEAIIKSISKQRFTSRVVLDITKSAVVVPVLILFSRLCPSYSLVDSSCSGNPLLAQNRKDLSEKVVSENADLGIIWDSDGDRVIFVDKKGEMIPVPFVLGLLAAAEVATSVDKLVAVDVRAGLVVRDLVKEAGGEIKVFPAWAQFIKYAMLEDSNICFGGETSGHFVFRNFHRIDDGILAAFKFLHLWEDENAADKLTQLSNKYFELPEMNFPCQPESAPDILERLAEYYRKFDYLISVEDGLTVFGTDFKFNLRASLTEPFLRLNLEAGNNERAGYIVKDIGDHLNH